MFPVPFALYADFESFITPSGEHVPSGFCCLRVSKFPQYDHKIHTYSGDNVVQEFLKYVTGEQTEIDSILSSNNSMNPLTDRERLAHNAATICSTCENKFTENNYKVRHHCHVTGEYIGPVCNSCNLQLKTGNLVTSHSFPFSCTMHDRTTRTLSSKTSTMRTQKFKSFPQIRKNFYPFESTASVFSTVSSF